MKNLAISVAVVSVVCCAIVCAYGQPPETAEPQREHAPPYMGERAPFVHDGPERVPPPPPPEEIERLRRHEEELRRREEELVEFDRELADRERELDMFAGELERQADELGFGEPGIEEVVVDVREKRPLKLLACVVVM